MPEVSVLTTVWNDEKHIAETLASLCYQTFEDIEIIIVDDCSTDGSVKIIESFMKSDKRIKMINLKMNLGPYGAANEGLKIAAGNYIIRNDSDDISLPNRIQKQIEFLKLNPALKACSSHAQKIDHNSKIIDNDIVKSVKGQNNIKWHLFLRCPLVHSTACVEKTVFDSLGGYNSSFASQDYRLWCYLSRKNLVSQIPEVLVYYRKNPRGISFTKTLLQKENGYKVAQDHIMKVIGKKFSKNKIKALNAFGNVKKGFKISEVIKVSAEWDALWQSDDSLSTMEKDNLYNLSASLRKSFLTRNKKIQFFSFIYHLNYFLNPKPR